MDYTRDTWKCLFIVRPFSSIAASPRAPTVGAPLCRESDHAHRRLKRLLLVPTGIVGKGREQGAEALPGSFSIQFRQSLPLI